MSVILLLLLFFAAVLGTRALKPAQRPRSDVPSSLPVKAKPFFFTRSERAFYEALLQALDGQPYRVFANVRLQDLFQNQAQGQAWAATQARMRDKHVDFLIVSLPDYRPVLGLELDGESHERPRQQYRDQVKDVLFRSGGLKLLRLSTRDPHSAASLRVQLGLELSRSQG